MGVQQCEAVGIILMSQLSSRQILKAQRNFDNHHFISQMRRQVNNNQLKISKQVYDLQSRNIGKFTKEWEAMQRKIRMAEKGEKASRSLPVKRVKGRYDDNQLMELSFSGKFHPVTPKPAQDEVSVMTIRNSSRGGDSSRNLTFKTSLKHGYSFMINYVEHSKSRQRGVSLRQKSNSLANDRFSLRRRMGTQWELSPMKESEISLKQTNTASNAQYRATDQFIIDVTRDKMERFIKNMHRLEWAYTFLKGCPKRQAEQSKEFRSHMKKFEFDLDSPIDQHAINFMVSRRYHLHTNYLQDIYEQRDRFLTEQTNSNQRKKLAEEGEYPLLSSLANHSILGLLQKHLQTRKPTSTSQIQQEDSIDNNVHFSLPFSEFISCKETKNSIYQLVGMSARMGLKMAFGIFDKNRNGLIDEEDLLQLISLSREMPALQIDIATLAKAMLSFNSKRSLSQRPRLAKQESAQSRMRQNRLRNTTMFSKESQDPSYISPIEERDSDSQRQVNQQALSNSGFSIDKLYIFLRDKEKGNNTHKKTKNKPLRVQSLNFVNFCKAFEFRRPYLVYDLFQFIFGASLGDFKQHIQTEITAHLNKLQTNHSTQLYVEEQQTLQQKWNKRLKESNAILQSFIRQKQL